MHRVLIMCVVVAAAAAPASAQERPFLLSVTTADDAKPAVRFDYDVGVGERAFQSDIANQPEQRFGMQASRGRFTLLARFGIAEVGSSFQSSQSGEALYSVLGPANWLSLAVGGGMLHEAGGVNVVLGRLIGGIDTSSMTLYGNVLFQKPLSSERDALDLITSVGWSRKLGRGVSLGVEAIGEDLEGFWDREEAEGGARLLAGPSIHISPGARRWQLTATGGPVFHPSDTGRSSGALRHLPPETRRTSYALKVALSVSLTAER
jgi:hypothetical protein